MSCPGVTDDGSLQFFESEAKEIKLTPFRWLRSCKLSDNYFTRFKDKDGVPHLREMAMRSVIKHRHGLSEDVLKDVPWEPLGAMVWTAIVKMKGVTVSVWKEFSIAYAAHAKDAPRLNLMTAPSILPLDLLASTIPLISSSNFEFLTVVNIVNQDMDLDFWMSLCRLNNLRALLVDSGRLPCRFDERVAKAWASHAIESGAFPQMHSFVLCSYHTSRRTTVSSRTMKMLLALPNLMVVGLRGINIASSAEQNDLGWRREKYIQNLLPTSRNDTAAGTDAAHVTQHGSEHTEEKKSSFAMVQAILERQWPAPATRPHSPKLVVRIGNTADKNVFRLSYSLISSFTFMVRESSGEERVSSQPDACNVSKMEREPKIRKHVLKDANRRFAGLHGFG